MAPVHVTGDVLLEPRLGRGGAAEDLAARPQALVLEVLLLLVRVLTSGVDVLQWIAQLFLVEMKICMPRLLYIYTIWPYMHILGGVNLFLRCSII